MRLCSIGRTLALTFALALASTQAVSAQYPGLWPTYGAYTYPGVGGFGYPGAAIGYGGWGYPGFGFGRFGLGGFGFGGFGVGLGGFGAVGYPPIAPYAYAPAYMGGYSAFAGAGPYGVGYGGLWSNPATLSLGVTPLAIQAGLMERGLSRTVVTPSAVVAAAPAARPAPAANPPQPTATVPLTPGTYRITVERIDPAPPAEPDPR